MTYPYIGKAPVNDSKDCKEFDVCVFHKPESGTILDGNSYHPKGHYSNDWCEQGVFKNITSEYLANTYGEVKSKGHAEFIVKLAEVNGIYFDGEVSVNSNYFCFFPSNSKQLTFWRKEKDASKNGSRKLITIPLPPESNVNTPEEDFEMKQIAKNNKPKLAGVEEVIRDSLNENGDNLIFGGDDKCDEALLKTLTYAIETAWTPKVGDKAIINNGAECTIKCIDADMAWVKLDEGYSSINKRFLSEYRTPEMELSHDVAMIIVDGYTNKTALEIANEIIDLVSDFITKKPR